MTKKDKIILLSSISLVIAIIIFAIKISSYYNQKNIDDNIKESLYERELSIKKYNEEKEKQIKEEQITNKRKIEACEKYKYLEYKKIRTGKNIDDVTNEIYSLGFENYGEPVVVPAYLSERNIRCTEFMYNKYESGFNIVITATVYDDNLITLYVEALTK